MVADLVNLIQMALLSSTPLHNSTYDQASWHRAPPVVPAPVPGPVPVVVVGAVRSAIGGQNPPWERGRSCEAAAAVAR